LEDHLLVELSDTAPVLEDVDRVEATVRDRAWIRHGQSLGSRPAPDRAFHTVPHDARAQLRELLRGVAPGQHVEHGVERPPPEVAVWVCVALLLVPLLGR